MSLADGQQGQQNGVASAASAPFESEVLGDANFTLLYNGTWVLQAYQGVGCPFSDKLQTIWPAIVQEGHVANDTIRFASLDAQQHRAATTVLEVKVFPTIKLIQNGSVFTYRGNLTKAAILDFIAKGYRDLRWYNRLPTTYSLLNKLQLEAYFAVQAIEMYIAKAICRFVNHTPLFCKE
ncbi:hypothetical protein BC831DRAFT_465376 [Entophlyctis helioformis]|nr:hypothetical protein BC831DRAFT_465376 [Entophlyctis helioformis]